jgi:uncharacterized protein
MDIASDEFLNGKIAEITKGVGAKGKVIVAFSGGIDSSVVAMLAHRALGNKSLAVTIDSPLLPSGELEVAKGVAEQIRVNHLVVKLNELEIPGFSNNPPDRCYLCKKFRIKKLRELAAENDSMTIVEGTNLSDLGEYRPGLKAAKELGVYSPLLEAGLHKGEIHRVAQLLGSPMASKPAGTCLATRIPYNRRLTITQLARIDKAESYIRSVTGAKVLRVRSHGNLARIEVGAGEQNLFFDLKVLSQVARGLKELGYKFVTADLEGYRSGSFDHKFK